MADEQDSPKRARPVAPALPPFKGQAGAQRPTLANGAGQNGQTTARPFAAPRPATSPLRTPNVAAGSASESAPAFIPAIAPRAVVPPGAAAAPPAVEAKVSAPAPVAPANELGLEPEAWGVYAPPPAKLRKTEPEIAAPAATEDYGSHSPQSSADALPFPPFDSAAGVDAQPHEAAQALEGIPYFDAGGAQHAVPETAAPRTSGRMHRVEFNLADVLERLASQLRSGDITVPDVDPLAGDAAALASLLASLLRQRAR